MLLARDMKRKYVLWKKGRLLSKNGSKGRADGIDEETRERFWREGLTDRMKESVCIQWIKTTCVRLRWGHRNAAHICEERWRHLHPPGAPHACFQNLFLPCQPSSACKRQKKKKLLACRLHCGLHLVRLAKQINKYSLLLHGHLPSWPVNRTMLWKALPW